MTGTHRTLVRSAIVAAALMFLAACTPLPPYDTTFTLTITPDGGDPVVVRASDAERPGIFGQLASLGEQERSLWVFIDNGLTDDQNVAYWYWRYEDDGTGWVEQVTVRYGGEVFEAGPLPVGGTIPDAFRVESYSDGVGRVTGGMQAYDGFTGITVTLTDLDALSYSSEASDTTPPIE
jgi:hypothetical protein